ncbi:abscisic acid responsive element-binding factor 1 [Musa troglodytarum]|uniref:Abscisic acid responsive element-binding factor 1 n=1 Tax=Musa troglodytarum TaxID=320322 RepID=A0A9E7K3D8_9LILI|nr:abscisic acid responsive element-binding factor 1 [Musa troglodytarum]URE02242.1 abscisic acid responsive element-binding factor 1 [Musa troglodytarum]
MNFNKHSMMGDGGGGSGAEAKGGGGLARQTSVYSLTFDEFQSTLGGLGKDFGSMNMDELLKNIWTAEESQVMAAAAAPVLDAGLQRQGSFTLPRTLSQKTVDEVWRGLVCLPQNPPAAAVAGVSHHQRQPTFGEMTLEEFLVRAGVVREQSAAPSIALPQRLNGDNSNNGNSNNNAIINVLFGDPPIANNASSLALGFTQASRNSRDVVLTNPIANSSVANLPMMATAEPSQFVVPHGVVDLGNPQRNRGGGLVGIADAGLKNGLMSGAVGLGTAAGTVAVGSPANHLASDALRKSGGDLSSVSPVPYAFGGGLRGRKPSAVEKVLERRQRRMIKNRESAARSRARKQAYTMELEAEVAKLKELNEELQKKQEKMMDMQKHRVLETINQQRGPKKLCLRRTQTGPW